MEKAKVLKLYRQLGERIKAIKKNFNFKPGINGLTKLQSDKLRAILLLCHAEFEAYIENLAYLLIDDAKMKWDKNRRANYILASLLADSEKINADKNVLTRIGKAIADYKKAIEKNHGIKEENIKKIFNPLGFEISDFDALFISTLDSFGGNRGLVAHTSAKTTTLMYDKATIISDIDYIYNNLDSFQQTLLSKSN